MVSKKPLLPSSSASLPAAKKKSNKFLILAATLAFTLLIGTLYIDSLSTYHYSPLAESHKRPSPLPHDSHKYSSFSEDESHKSSFHSANESDQGFFPSTDASSHKDSSPPLEESKKRLSAEKPQRGSNVKGIYKWILGILRKAVPIKPRILVWTDFFSQKDWFRRPSEIGGCPVDCDVTRDRNLRDHSDAIVFHSRNTHASDMPERRSNSKQRWVFFNLESPVHSYVENFIPLDGKIDWTATYRLDSDIYTPYSKVIPRRNPGSFPKPKYREKPSLICWIVSNCDAPSQRQSYVKILERYATVMIYGKCGYLKCPTTNADDCYQAVSNNCKFYLSFENSLCTDYVTEKLFLALKTDMVPVVMGGADYSRILPNHSYIDALEFDDPKDLATYLFELDTDPERYMRYHSWKESYEVVESATEQLPCDLCKKLYDDVKDRVNDNGSSIERTVRYPDLMNWWVKNSTCYNWKEYLFTHPVR